MTTNRERINNMTNEELAEFLGKYDCLYCIYKDIECYRYKNVGECDCTEGILQWLNKEIEE